jgi:hypothetical protein
VGPSLAESRRRGGTPKKSAIPNPHRGGGQNVLKITNLGHFFLWKAVSWLTLARSIRSRSTTTPGSAALRGCGEGVAIARLMTKLRVTLSSQ